MPDVVLPTVTVAVLAVLGEVDDTSCKAIVSPELKIADVPFATPLRMILVQPEHVAMAAHVKLAPDNVTVLLVTVVLRATPV